MEEKLARLTKLEGPRIPGRKIWNGLVTKAQGNTVPSAGRRKFRVAGPWRCGRAWLGGNELAQSAGTLNALLRSYDFILLAVGALRGIKLS